MIHPIEIQNLFQRTLPESVVNSGDTTRQGSSFSPANESPVSLSTANTQAVNQQLLRSVQDALAIEGVSLEGLYPEDVTPEKTANTILGFVNNLYAGFVEQGRSDEEIDDFFDQIRAGVEQGFSEARGILEGLGVLNGEIASNIDKTFDLVQTGLDNLQNPPDEIETPAVQSSAVFNSASFERSEDTSIEITTREGDVVTIQIEKDAAAEQSFFQSQDSNTRVQGFTSSQSASASLNFSVVGDLNAEETAAIEDLVKRIDKVSDKFFSGNLVAAFNKARNLGFDADQIASFSVDLSFEQTTSVTTAYQQTRLADTDNDQNDDGFEQTSLPVLVDTVRQISDIIDDADDLFEEPAKNVGQLIKEITNLKNNDNNSPLKQLEAQANNTLNDVIDQLIESLQALQV